MGRHRLSAPPRRNRHPDHGSHRGGRRRVRRSRFAAAYKKPWAISEARDYITKESGRQFDPGCVAAFLRRFDVIAPIGERAQIPEVDRNDVLAKRSDAAAPSEPLRVAS